MATRTERDSLGPVEVPVDALYGAQTQRAVENFPVSGLRFDRRFIRSLGMVKRACAHANHALGELTDAQHAAIVAAAEEVIDGRWDDQFPVDIFQTGSGTSSNMNANEVLATRAGQLGAPVHPNDHVNRSQSSNDVIPTTLHVAGATAIHEELLPALERLAEALEDRGQAFADVVKSGRTHLMDATPVTLGQEFAGYAAQVRHGLRRARAARDALMELAIGGTAVGTGLNRPPAFPDQVIARLSDATGLPFRRASDPFEAQGAQDGVVEAHGHLATLAVSFTKIANDLRLLGSGPRTGLAEIRLPAVQPGSSIMPGKVNPVHCEMLTMIAARVQGNQTTVGIAGAGGHLELNTYLPLLAHCLLESVGLLARGAQTFADRCVRGIEADEARCRATVEDNLALCTALAPVIGYDRAAQISKDAWASGQTVREVAREQGVLADDELDRLLDPRRMAEPSAEQGSAGAVRSGRTRRRP